MNSNNVTIKVNLDDHLADFVMNQLGSDKQPVRVVRNHYIGAMLYRLIDKVPEDCRFTEPVVPGKKQLSLSIGWLGGRSELRKNPFCYTYFPLSKQREFENVIRNSFDLIFFNVIEIAKEYTDEQYKDLIENFCNRCSINFVKHFDALKKKHYRARIDFLEKDKKN